MIALLLTMPDGTELECALLGDEIKVGRIEENDLVLDDVSVSTSHAVIEEGEDGVFVITDLDSTNGTKVNGTPVMKAKIRAGDAIKIGGIHGRIVEINDEEEDAEEVTSSSRADDEDAEIEEDVSDKEDAGEDLEEDDSDEDEEEDSEEAESEDEKSEKASKKVVVTKRKSKALDEEVPTREERREKARRSESKSSSSSRSRSSSSSRSSLKVSKSAYQEPMFDGHFWFTLICLMVLAAILGLCVKHFNLTGGFLVKDFFSQNPVELKADPAE